MKYIANSERRRSTRVMIHIPIQVVFCNSEPNEPHVNAFTVVVNAHGCLLTMDIKPDEGQSMRLLNTKCVVEKSGTVIYRQSARDGSYAVAFGFDSAAPDLWSIVTAPEDWEALRG
ncbi:MAG: hypothetical protein WBR26_11995 [Candidatus Acidiferrum sp.]